MTPPVPILMLANFADRVGGGEESLLGLVEGLDRNRVLPHVAVPGHGEMETGLRAMGVPVDVVPTPPVRPWTLLAVWRSVRQLRSLLERWQITLVHAHGSRGALYALLAAPDAVPVVWHVRVAERDRWLDPLLSSRAAAIIVNSQATARRFTGFRGVSRKVHVIYNGVDLHRVAPGAPDRLVRQRLHLPAHARIVLFAGRLEYGKAPDLFVEAAGLVHGAVRDVCFVMAGSGPLLTALEARGRALALPLRCVGHQSDLLPLLRAASVVVVPSRQEAFGRVLIEAMAVHVPVVATAVGGIPEVCLNDQTGLLVPPEDPVALATAIIKTLTDPGATARRVAAGVKRVETLFSLDVHVAKVTALYAALRPGAPGDALARIA